VPGRSGASTTILPLAEVSGNSIKKKRRTLSGLLATLVTAAEVMLFPT
jgi:hypothetical protein